LGAQTADSVRVSGRDVPGKTLFPDDGITKGDLIRYYQKIDQWMLPYLEGRPLVISDSRTESFRPASFKRPLRHTIPPGPVFFWRHAAA
jgi:DNA primase